MNEFFILVGVVAIVLGVVIWLIFKSERPSLNDPEINPKNSAINPADMPAPKDIGNLKDKFKFSFKMPSLKFKAKEKPQNIKPVIPKFSFKSIFSKKSKSSTAADFNIADPSPLPSLLEQLEAERKAKKERQLRKDPAMPQPNTSLTQPSLNRNAPSPSLTAGMKPLSKEEEKAIEQEIQVAAELSELKEKYAKVEKILQEKTTELEKSENALSIEIKNRKDFNKVKDILEKELKDFKERVRDSQAQVNQAQVESESYKKRIGVLEEKVTHLEKDILSKEKEIDELNKKIAEAKKTQKPTVVQAPKPVAEKPNELAQAQAPEIPQPEVTSTLKTESIEPEVKQEVDLKPPSEQAPKVEQAPIETPEPEKSQEPPPSNPPVEGQKQDGA